MQSIIASLSGCTVEILTEGEEFLGLGAITIGDTQVRGGRLPLRPDTQTFTGQDLDSLRFLGIEASGDEVRIKVEAIFRPLPVKLMRDHSFDPVHEMADWDEPAVDGTGRMDIVLRPAAEAVEGTQFRGFSYHYDYQSEQAPIFYILDMASWELDGDITGATVVSQSSCSSPVATFAPDTVWTTEGVIHWDMDEASKFNTVMTHNLPRWASHGSFDFQYRDEKTLIGVFERVDLIRSIQMREPGKPELKTFDKHIFDQTLSYRTSPKAILLNTDAKSDAGQKNLWTWLFDIVHNRAREEYGLKEEPLIPRISQNFGARMIIDDYRKDLLPVATALGFREIFIDNMNKTAGSEGCPHPDFHWNSCCGHEYEIAPKLGGKEMLIPFLQDCDKAGIRAAAWTNNDQAHSSPLNYADDRHTDCPQWYVRMEDARTKYGGAYAGVFSIWDFNHPSARRNWIDSLLRIKEETGLNGYLFDSFYNLGFMPVNYSDCTPTTQWRALLQSFKELQDAGIYFLIESFGPFGSPQHGCPVSYGLPENLFAAYKLTVGLGYTTIPSGSEVKIEDDHEIIYRYFAHMASPSFGPFQNGVRIDQLWTEKHKQALADYYENREFMQKRFLQDDGKSVLWHDREGMRATLWNIRERKVQLPGTVIDLASGEPLPEADGYRLGACRTYAFTGAELPTHITEVS